MPETAAAFVSHPIQVRPETSAGSDRCDQKPARTLILSLTELEYAAIVSGLETISPDTDEAREIAGRTARKVTDAWAAGQEGGITTAELALLEANAWASPPGFDTLASKVKAAQAGKPGQWRDYLITGAQVDRKIADLRGSMTGGYDNDRVNRVLGAISDATGLDLVCVWAYCDGTGPGGHSQFYVKGSDGQLRELAGDLWQWLNEDPGDPDTPGTPGDPDTWPGEPAPFTTTDLAWTDGMRNYAHDAYGH